MSCYSFSSCSSTLPFPYSLLTYGWIDFIFRRQAKAVSPGSIMDSPTFLTCIQRLRRWATCAICLAVAPNSPSEFIWRTILFSVWTWSWGLPPSVLPNKACNEIYPSWSGEVRHRTQSCWALAIMLSYSPKTRNPKRVWWRVFLRKDRLCLWHVQFGKGDVGIQEMMLWQRHQDKTPILRK